MSPSASSGSSIEPSPTSAWNRLSGKVVPTMSISRAAARGLCSTITTMGMRCGASSSTDARPAAVSRALLPATYSASRPYTRGAAPLERSSWVLMTTPKKMTGNTA